MIATNIQKINQEIGPRARLIAVSKTKPVALLLEAYAAGQRLFGENKVQELVAKQLEMPADTEWHMIGHLQSNKVKYLAPIVSMIHSVDSASLLHMIQKEAAKCNRVIPVLLQVFIATEETKYGFDREELISLLEVMQAAPLTNVRICGLMGMASNTQDENQIRREFSALKALFEEVKQRFFSADPAFCELSIGMSSDYRIAVEEGATLVRIGSLVFGSR